MQADEGKKKKTVFPDHKGTNKQAVARQAAECTLCKPAPVGSERFRGRL